MSKGIIGRPFTFTALFRDVTGVAIAVNSPTIEVFYYNDTGVRIDVIPAGTVLAASLPVETGRYAHTLTISSSYDTRVQLYGIMWGIDPVTLDTLMVEREVDLFSEEGTAGLGISFVKPGAC